MTDEPRDLYGLSPKDVKDPPATALLALRKIGPGMILAASIVGTGELIATTNVGAQAGFALLWLVLLSCFIKVFVQVELGRYAISSGETTLSSFRRLPLAGIVLVWWWFVMMLVTQTQIGAMIGGIGEALSIVLPGVPALVWAVLVTAITAGMLATGSYRLVERLTTGFVIVFTILTVGCVALLAYTPGHEFGLPELKEGFTFRIPGHAVAAAFAMIGITGVGASELVAYPYWCIEKGYARSTGPNSPSEDWARRARGWLGVMRLDALVSMVVYTVATLAFFLLGAAVLNSQARTSPEKVAGAVGVAASPQGHLQAATVAAAETTERGLPDKPRALLEELARMYAPVMGDRGATWFIVLGAFAVLYSTLFSATAANSRATSDFLHVSGLIPFTHPDDRKKWIRIFCVFFPCLGLVLYLFIGSPVLMVMIGGIVQAVTLPLIASAALYLRYRRTDARLRPGLVWDLFLWLSMLAMLVAALYGVWNQLVKWM